MSFSQPFLSQVFPDMHRAVSLLDQHFANLSSRTVFNHPPTDITETKTGYQLQAEIPGYQKQDIEINLSDDHHTLVIGGKQQSTTVNQSPDVNEGDSNAEAKLQDQAPSTGDVANVDASVAPYWHRSERFTGSSFTRAFSFPHALNAEAIKATYENGILTIHVSKAEKSTPLRIPID
ncbi:HSP20-like chaperone [Chlamydoabsidia padenii]|nr:HSP20-like chaperone [Chlamydoabsidia padenii]